MKWVLVVVLAALAMLAGWYFSWRATGNEVVDAGASLSSDELVVDEPGLTPQSADDGEEAKSESDSSTPDAIDVRMDDKTGKKAGTFSSPPVIASDVARSRGDVDELNQRIRSADALPAERPYLVNGRLNASESIELMGSEAFGEMFEALARQAYGDFDAQALSEVYGDYVDDLLASEGSYALDRFVCGMRFCVGEALALDSSASWHPLGLYSAQYDGPPMFASVYDTYLGPDGTTWYRFLFTTDPESRGLVFPQP